MSFKEELRAIQVNSSKLKQAEEQAEEEKKEREYQQRLASAYEWIKMNIRSQVANAKENTNLLSGEFCFKSQAEDISRNNVNNMYYSFYKLCETETKVSLFSINVYVRVSLTEYGKRVVYDLVDKARKDGISLSILPALIHLSDCRKWDVIEYDTLQKWESRLEYSSRIKKTSHGNYEHPLPACLIVRYEIHL